MSLKITLKSNERLIVGGAVVKNGGKGTVLYIENTIPILREKDILTRKAANTPAKRIYLAIQLMYTSHNPSPHHELYFSLLRDILRAAPSTLPIIESINNHILTGDMYKALKCAKKLISYEEELIKHAQRSTSVPVNSQTDRKSA